ncbi:MAG: hypothetical protein UHM56_01675 [Phascolarctobacterium sp.]|nr:hypothetical protein [Phascolarctobacterium sp.]
MENYQAICNALCSTLRLTRNFDDLESLEHRQEGRERYVIARFVNGSIRKITVTADSGIAMIKDILRNI